MKITDPTVRKILGLDEPPTRNTVPYKGVMTFDHKTGGSIQVMSAESYERNKKYYIPNGPRSCVKNFMKG